MNIAIISLGCPKNQVDADVFCRQLLQEGHKTVPSPELAEVCIINTCGFIQSAKEEAIETIFDAVRLKKRIKPYYVIVTGCLAQRYENEIAELLPEVDAFVGIDNNHLLPEIIIKLANGGKKRLFFEEKKPFELGGARVISTPEHYAWLKIAEGCSNACSYCAIPKIRGPLRSRDFDSCVKEAEWLAEQGVKEIVLVAQDVTAYACENGGEPLLAKLLTELDKVEGIEWIRLLYTYPERITKELISCVKNSSKVLPYFDMPIQHINDEILTSMRRRGGKKAITDAIAMIRSELPEAVLRTSLIAGYPGESEEQFEELCEFIKDIRFDRLGCFAYSEEEGTTAAKLPDMLPEEVRRRRAEIVMEIQADIMAQKQAELVGKTIEVICDEFSEEDDAFICRSRADAPEIDGNVFLPKQAELVQGGIYSVKVVKADVYDLYANLT